MITAVYCVTAYLIIGLWWAVVYAHRNPSLVLCKDPMVRGRMILFIVLWWLPVVSVYFLGLLTGAKPEEVHRGSAERP